MLTSLLARLHPSGFPCGDFGSRAVAGAARFALLLLGLAELVGPRRAHSRPRALVHVSPSFQQQGGYLVDVRATLWWWIYSGNCAPCSKNYKLFLGFRAVLRLQKHSRRARSDLRRDLALRELRGTGARAGALRARAGPGGPRPGNTRGAFTLLSHHLLSTDDHMEYKVEVYTGNTG